MYICADGKTDVSTVPSKAQANTRFRASFCRKKLILDERRNKSKSLIITGEGGLGKTEMVKAILASPASTFTWTAWTL